MSSFQQKHNKMCKERGKYATYTGEKRQPTENVLQGDPDFGLSRQRLYFSYYKYIQIN